MMNRPVTFTFLICILFVLFIDNLQADIYVTKDKNGVRHFTNVPPDKSKYRFA